MKIPEPIIIDGEKNKELKQTVNQIIACLHELVGEPEVELKPATWSNTEATGTLTVGTVRPLDGTSLVDVYDGSSWLRMTKDYYNDTYAKKDSTQTLDSITAELDQIEAADKEEQAGEVVQG